MVKDPDGCIESAIHVMTPRGPRSALKRCDYVQQATASFEIWVAGATVTTKDLKELLMLGQEVGLGASRSQGYGKFTLEEFKPI